GEASQPIAGRKDVSGGARRVRGLMGKREDSTMADASGFRIRLRVRVAKGLTTEATSLNFVVANRDVTITSQNKEEPLSKSRWIVLSARRFSTDEQARQFGIRLRSIVQLAALSARLGVDVGEDKPTSWVNEDFARSLGLIREHERVAPNVHGLAILPDDDNTRFPTINAQATVTADPEHLLSALRELGRNDGVDFSAAENAVRLLNLALITSESLAQMVLALSAVEELGQKEEWSEAQLALIKQLAVAAEGSKEGTGEERAEVARAIQTGVFRLSLRQSVIRLLARLGQNHLRKEWDRLYGIRSGLFHGTARLSDTEISQAAFDTVSLCGQIILGQIGKEGARLPSIAATHFNIGASASEQAT
ncbi:MAG TPA: hypothetical protein VFR34_15840, partial [Paracoccaceae bacterium]|nr:hypothetical protein [Paracoccaceae bacterium]